MKGLDPHENGDKLPCADEVCCILFQNYTSSMRELEFSFGEATWYGNSSMGTSHSTKCVVYLMRSH